MLVTIEDLAQFANTDTTTILRIIDNPESFYSEFRVPKANGDTRTINPPTRILRSIQRRLLAFLYKTIVVPPYIHGGIPKRSIFTHAKGHVGRKMVATLDVKDFFGSTTTECVARILRCATFTGKALEAAILLTTLNGSLPQGAPSSCLLANAAFFDGDALLVKICKKRRLLYTRYVDDVAISGDCVFGELRGPFQECIEAAGYVVAKGKVHFRGQHKRQTVTNLVVNDKLRPTKQFVSELKNEIRMCLAKGPRMLADINGVSMNAIKQRLTGRVSHVAQSDKSLGKKLRGMLCGVDWQLHPSSTNHAHRRKA